MKIQIFAFILLIITLLIFTGCESNEPVDSSNYWNSNTLIRNQLNGKVKTVITAEMDGQLVEQYNQDGFITQIVSPVTDYTTNPSTPTTFSSTTNYYYDVNGKLIKTDFNNDFSGISYSETYEYKNTGRYVIQYPLLVTSYGLMTDLKTKNSPDYKIEYVFQGDKMLLIETYINVGKSSQITTKINYTGKYPSNFTRQNGTLVNMTFAENGMFKTYTEESDDGNFKIQYKYYFKPDDKYLLIDSIVDNSIVDPSFVYGESSHSVTNYTYDLNKNIILEEINGVEMTKYTYEYDSQNNWTTKSKIYKEGSLNWSEPIIEARTITYW